MQFHPLAYTVKLNIEMSMADLIVKVAKARNRNNISHPSVDYGASAAASSGTAAARWRSRTLSSSAPTGGSTKWGRWYGHNYATSEATSTSTSTARTVTAAAAPVASARAGQGSGIELSNMAAAKTSDEVRDLEKSIYTTREVHVEFESAPQNGSGLCWPSHYGGVPAEEDEDVEQMISKPQRSRRLYDF